MTKHIAIKVTGKVQGVSFRFHTAQKADELRIKGIVRNEPDGTVYIEAEGEESALEFFIAWVNQGPPAAQVERIEVKEREAKTFTRFSIER